MTVSNVVKAPQDSGVPEYARDFGVADRVVIITGGGQGIGREMARQFGASGAIVVIADLNGSNADAVASEVQNAGGRALGIQVDVADEVSVNSMVDQVVKAYGRVDVLVNNAAIFATLDKRKFFEIPTAEWDTVMRVNINGCFFASRAVVPAMRAQGWGRIINVGSTAVTRGVGNYLHYVTSKSAMIGFTASMSRELGEFGINVNCVRLGPTATEVDRTHNPTTDLRSSQMAQQCIKSGLQPPDIIGAFMFLASPASRMITGQTIAVDAGYTHNG